MVNYKMDLLKYVSNLNGYIFSENFNGYDPYDALNSKYLNKLNSTWLKLLFTQFFVYSPINFRPLFKIEKQVNSKTLGLILKACCNLYKCKAISEKDFTNITEKITSMLEESRSSDYNNHCWGYNFPWQDLTRYMNPSVPSIVNTSLIANSFLDIYDVTENKEYLDLAESCSRFILFDINRSYGGNGDDFCFSYTPIDYHIVHNANMMASGFLARLSVVKNNPELNYYAVMSMDFSMRHQKNDGSWNYCEKSKTGGESKQVDFHQGYNIDSLIQFLIVNKNSQYIESLKKAIDFYINYQFTNTGASKWRYSLTYPIDIHHQAQGMITFINAYKFFEYFKYYNMAKLIYHYTIKNFFNQNQNYFYYQKWPGFINKISYMRWSQAWMMLALSYLLCEQNIE